MSRKKSPATETEAPLYWGMTPNQIVAYNLAQARLWKDWTQDQAAEALAPYVGSRWSKANFSAAERSVAGGRIRNFDADEIVAFARAFELPVTFFFMPPVPWADNLPVRLQTPDAGPLGKALATMIDLVFGERYHVAILSLRLEQFLDALQSEALTAPLQRIRDLADARIGKVINQAFRDMSRWQTQLRNMANRLEGMAVQAKAAVWEQTDLSEDFRE